MPLKDQILASSDRKTVRVPTPEWGCGTVTVRTLSHAERRRVLNSQETAPDLYTARLAAAVIVDDDGNRVFTDADAEKLAEKSGAVLDRVVEAWMKLATSPAEVKEDEKNS